VINITETHRSKTYTMPNNYQSSVKFINSIIGYYSHNRSKDNQPTCPRWQYFCWLTLRDYC